MWPWSRYSRWNEVKNPFFFDFASAHEFNRTYSTHRDYIRFMPYDFYGVVYLMLAAIENLRTNAEHRLEDEFAYAMSDDDRFFFNKLAEYA